MSFPFPQAAWGASPHVPAPQQPSLAPDGMSILPAQAASAETALPPPEQEGTELNGQAESGAGGKTAASIPHSNQMWHPMSAPLNQLQAPEVAQGISFTKMLEDHLQ